MDFISATELLQLCARENRPISDIMKARELLSTGIDEE